MVVRLGIDVDADRPVIVFEEVQDLMDRLLEFDFCGKAIGKLESVGLLELAITLRFVYRFDREVLSFEPSDRHRHPASLIAVIMNSGDLPRLPANRHHLEAMVFEDQIPRIEVRAPKKIFLDRINFDGILVEIFVDGFAYEFSVGNFAQAADKIVDGDSFHLQVSDKALAPSKFMT